MGFIACSEWGSGPPLVFLHGFCDNRSMWDEFVEPFTSDYRVIATDLPGFGDSELLPPPFTIDQVGDRMYEWLHDQKADRPLLIGHSLGGYVALSILDRHAEFVSGLVLFHSTPVGDSEERKGVRDRVIAFVREHGVQPYLDSFVPGLFTDKKDPAVRQALARMMGTKAEGLIGYAEAMRERPDRTDVLMKTQVPVLIIGGMNDSLIPIVDLENIAKKSLKAVFHKVPQAAHMGVFESKKQCQDTISSFVANTLPNRGYNF
jgi:pimeloyl-ACP methyl ester carboxylesterase